MSVTEFPKARRDDDSFDQACVWLSRIDRDLSAEEQADLQSWLSEHPDHLDLLVRIAKEWDRFDVLSQLIGDPPAVPKKRTPRRFAAKMAVGLAACVVIAIVFALLRDVPAPPGEANQVAERRMYTTEVGEQSSVVLSDGSELTLNTDTRLSVDYTATERRVMLQSGEIFVQVMADTNRPFNVYVSDRVVQAVGTAFNVEYVRQGEVEVIVTDGTVAIRKEVRPDPSAGPARSRIEPGEVLTPVRRGEVYRFSGNSDVPQPIEADALTSRLAWRSGNLVFHGETLAQAIREIERYTDAEIVIADDRLNDILVAGVFRAGDIDGLLRTLENNFDVAHQRLNAHQILLTSR